MWGFTIFIDTIMKAFQYGKLILLPLIILIIVLLIVMLKAKPDIKGKKVLRIIWVILVIVTITLIFTSRIWGPKLFVGEIALDVANQEKELEKKLEEKYNKNFTFVSKSDVILVDKYSGNSLGQDVSNDYAVYYVFKDDEGVFCTVMNKKRYTSDWYQYNLARYNIIQELEKALKKEGLKQKHYLYLAPEGKMIADKKIDEPEISNYEYPDIKTHMTFHLVLTKENKKSEEIVEKALKDTFDKAFCQINEFVVSDEELEKIKEYYESAALEGTNVEENYSKLFYKYDKDAEKKFYDFLF